VFGRKRYIHLGLLSGHTRLSAELMHAANKVQNKNDAVWMRHVLGPRQCLVAPLEGLLGIAKEP
jgi:hypothetical protein